MTLIASETPAGGGANNTGNRDHVLPVGQDCASHMENGTVIEAARQDRTPAPPASDQFSQETTMNFTGKPIPLPLDPGINRCLAHGHLTGEWCDRCETCAAHQTIKHDRGITTPAEYRKCRTDNMAGYLPLEGFPVEEEGMLNAYVSGRAA